MSKDSSKRTWPRCAWDGCRQYALADEMQKFCMAHLTIITFHGWRDDSVRRKVIDMGGDRPKRDRPPRKQPVTDGHVYFLLSDNLVKIGWTGDVDRRLSEYGPGARILAVMPGTRKDEGWMHRKFSDLRTNRREWFSYHPRVMEEVERIVTEHGEPPRDLNEPMVTKRIVGPRLNRPTQRRARSLNN